MKNWFIIFILVLVPFIHYSQSDSTLPKIKLPETPRKLHGYLTFGFGSAIPKGLLASQNVKSDSAGLAKNGLDIRLSFGYLFLEHFGICASYYSQSFVVNSKAIADYLNKINPNYSFDVNVTKNWRLNGTLLGLYAHIPIDESGKICLEPRAMIGLSSGRSPEYSITTQQTIGFAPSSTVKQSSDISDPVVTYVLGGSLRAELDRFCLSANVDYTNLLKDTYYSNVTISYSSGGGATPPPSQNVSFYQEMRSLSIWFGIGFRFGQRTLGK